MATTSTNIKKKPILVIKSPENSSKSSSSRNVRFVPDIKINDEEPTIPIQDSLPTKSSTNKSKSNRKIKTNQQHKKK